MSPAAKHLAEHPTSPQAVRSSRPSPRSGLHTLKLATWALLALTVAAVPAAASSGDRHSSFHLCTNLCQVSQCEPHSPLIPLYLRLFGWTCTDNCNYHCAHRLTNEADAGREYYHQFFGKWAFYRLGPIQEPLSVLASLGNLVVHYRGLQRVQRTVRAGNNLRPWLESLAYIQINTWLWSTIFHARDTPITEKLDYFSAMITIAFTLLYAIVRIFGIVTPKTVSPLVYPVSGAVAVFVLWHFFYVLSFAHFPYGYHVGVAIVLGMIHNVLWLIWTLSFHVELPTISINDTLLAWPEPYPQRNARNSRRPAHSNMPAILVGLTMAAMTFEVLDFAPFYRVLDSHALWHLATIPLGEWWWEYMCADANELDGGLLGPLSSRLPGDKSSE
ncbi:hypothetical protein VHUM_04002 [Vanrija humicola]|uniref:Post-GPI attachment to proteins factor 3 n=1 Tax=Vanrija humicola TaxID=5417 RepID=A0A7D8YW27_VANHU|nr:hypothetical protein VHUM_04002 [Vanrija humicola]